MRIRCSSLLLTFFIVSNTIAQNSNQEYPRFGYQQQFIVNHFLSGDQDIKIETDDQLNQFFNEMVKEWIKYVDDTIASVYDGIIPKHVLNNVDSYSYMFALYSITKSFVQPDDLRYHLLKDFMLPAFLIDLIAVRNDTDLLANKIIWPGITDNTFFIGSQYYKDKAIIGDLYYAVTELEKILNAPFDLHTEETEKNHKRLISSLNRYKYDIMAKYFFSTHEIEKAIEYFNTGISNQNYPIENILPFTNELVVFLSENNQKEKAFDVLSMVMSSTLSDEIPRDSLNRVFVLLENQEGEKLFNEVSLQAETEILKETNLVLEPKPQNWIYINDWPDKNKVYNDDYIFVDFWYSSCKPCIAEIPDLNKLHEMLKTRDDITFISVNADHFVTEKDIDFIRGLIKKRDIKFPVVYDSELSNITSQLNIAGYPFKTIVNNKGTVMQKVNNAQITLNTFYELIKTTD